MTSNDASICTPGHVLTQLNYYRSPADGGSDTYRIGSGNKPGENAYDTAEVRVQDIRGTEADFTLNEHGFQMLQGVEPIQSSDDNYLTAEYSKVIAEAIKAQTGASEVIVTSNSGRIRRPNDRRPAHVPLSYATLVHVDQSYDGARVKFSHRYPELVEKFDSTRWAVINWWQPFERPATRMPLAVCDARSIADNDWREITAVYTGSPNNVANHGMWRVMKPRDPDEHKWYYCSEMQPDEALLIKIFDSKEHGVSRRTPHSAFQSPFDHGPERTSIEFRCLAFWNSEPLSG